MIHIIRFGLLFSCVWFTWKAFEDPTRPNMVVVELVYAAIAGGSLGLFFNSFRNHYEDNSDG